VKRTIVESDDGKFRTLDTVDIFRRGLLPPGTVMPHVKTFNVLTCWSFEEGLPIEIRRLTNSQKSTLKFVFQFFLLFIRILV
jgi:hypothetical protein